MAPSQPMTLQLCRVSHWLASLLKPVPQKTLNPWLDDGDAVDWVKDNLGLIFDQQAERFNQANCKQTRPVIGSLMSTIDLGTF